MVDRTQKSTGKTSKKGQAVNKPPKPKDKYKDVKPIKTLAERGAQAHKERRDDK